MRVDHEKFLSLYHAQFGALKAGQAAGLRALLGFLEQDSDVRDPRWAAYMLATVKHECADTWQPIAEFGHGKGHPYGQPVTAKGSDGKTYTNTYYGRGYVQLTWSQNYQKMSLSLKLGDALLIHPDRVMEPPVAYQIMSFGMRNGSFTGKRLADFIDGSRCDYNDARRIINGLDQAAKIGGYAAKLEAMLRGSMTEGGYHIANAPAGVAARKGPGTHYPVVRVIANNSPIQIACQTHGEAVGGTNVWNRLSDGTYVTDFYCDTPNFNSLSPPLPACKGAPPPPPPPSPKLVDDYPYRTATPDTPDKWGFLCRECTSFVAWRLNQRGIKFTNRGFGHAYNWAEAARGLGYRVDHSPAIGAVAHFDPGVSFAGPRGHVAYVAEMNGDSITVEEYNFGYKSPDDAGHFAYHHPQRILHPSQVSNFIHVG